MFIRVQRCNSRAILKAPKSNEPLVVDKFSECHVTPFAVARRMVEYLEPQDDYNTLEPSDETGARVSALLASGHSQNETCAIERHHRLAAWLGLLGVPVI